MSIKDPDDLKDLRSAVALLESPALIAQLANVVGAPIEILTKALPASASKKISRAVSAALHKSADAALWTLENKPNEPASTKSHKAFAAAIGAVGGAFGFSALFIELPLSTTIMMRSVADVARSEGFNIEDISTKLACIEVFALGGPTNKDDAADTGYYVSRTFLADTARLVSKELTEVAAKQAAEAVGKGTSKFTAENSGKLISALIEKVATRFNFVITEKFALQAAPVFGAVSGATINTLFTDFYQDMARGHFIVKRLEEKYGHEKVKAEYKKIRDGSNGKS
jgi:hypothetical protein